MEPWTLNPQCEGLFSYFPILGIEFLLKLAPWQHFDTGEGRVQVYKPSDALILGCQTLREPLILRTRMLLLHLKNTKEACSSG